MEVACDLSCCSIDGGGIAGLDGVLESAEEFGMGSRVRVPVRGEKGLLEGGDRALLLGRASTVVKGWVYDFPTR
jgi:hypothetical protein